MFLLVRHSKLRKRGGLGSFQVFFSLNQTVPLKQIVTANSNVCLRLAFNKRSKSEGLLFLSSALAS